MSHWHEEIFNYFEHPITNAYTESVNNLAKAMNRMGRGYSFEVIRARMLYDAKARKAGTLIEKEPATQGKGIDGTLGDGVPGMDKAAPTFFKMMTAPPPAATRAVEYGPSLDVLTQMLEGGEFE